MGELLVFDTETTGLPKLISFNVYNDPQELKYYDSARMIEIAYIIYSKQGTEVLRKEFLIKPDGFEINNSNIHGITFKHANEKGIDIRDVLEEIHQDLNNMSSVKLIAHNILFDINILVSECYRYNKLNLVNKLKQCKTTCTMQMGMRVLNVPFCLKLVMLYRTLFRKYIEQDHRALSDVEICSSCYFKMISL